MNTSELNTRCLSQVPSDTDDAFFAKVREVLVHLGRKPKPELVQTKTVLDRVSGQVFTLLDKGYSFKDISLILEQCNIKLSADNIKEHCFFIQEKRLQQCEKIISRKDENALFESNSKIETGLRKALKNKKGLLLNYQPQIDVSSGHVIGAEALVRWEFEGRLVQPSEFISIAEKSDLIEHIGEWVLREACHEAKKWHSMGLGGERGIKMGVNLSVQQISHTYPHLVNDVLCDTGLDSNLLGLEITESFLLVKEILPVLQSLKDSGISLSIDDFGTGYSCLSQIKDLPFDTIKIDHSFVKNIETDKGSILMVETIIELANKFNMQTLAEGVENQRQAKIINFLGCSVFQGYLYSKPITGDEFIRYVNAETKFTN